MTLSHDELVAIGAEHCRRNLMAGLTVMTELRGRWGFGESPDVWCIDTMKRSHVIEAKASWNDFQADADKPWRASGRGMGQHRWYLCEPGVLTREALDRSRWGLLLTDGESVMVDVESGLFVADLVAERALIVKALCDARRMLGENGSLRPSSIDPWLSQIEDAVILRGECYTTEAIGIVGYGDRFTSRSGAVKAIDDACRKGKMPRIRRSRQDGKSFLVAEGI